MEINGLTLTYDIVSVCFVSFYKNIIIIYDFIFAILIYIRILLFFSIYVDRK